MENAGISGNSGMITCSVIISGLFGKCSVSPAFPERVSLAVNLVQSPNSLTDAPISIYTIYIKYIFLYIDTL